LSKNQRIEYPCCQAVHNGENVEVIASSLSFLEGCVNRKHNFLFNRKFASEIWNGKEVVFHDTP